MTKISVAFGGMSGGEPDGTVTFGLVAVSAGVVGVVADGVLALAAVGCGSDDDNGKDEAATTPASARRIDGGDG